MSALPQTTSPTPAGAAAEWIDLRTASRLCRKSEGQLARRCKDEFASAGHAMKLPPPLGGKSIWHISSVTIRQLQAEPAEPEFDARLLSDAQRLEHGRRVRIVAELEAALAATARAGGNVTDAMAAFAEKLAATERDAPSLRTLYRWVDAYRAKGASGLADRRWLSVKRHGQEDDFADFYRELKRLYLDQRRRSKRLCYDLTLHLAEENGWSVPHPRTASRLLAAIPCKTIDLHRNGAREYASTSAPYVERDYTRIVIGGVERDMRSNDVWCADHHQLDVWVALPGGDKPVRPWLCGWMDIRSRKMLGWKLAPCAPDSGTIIAAMRDALAACGKPLIAFTDNGKDFDSFALQGVTKRQRRTGAAPTGGVFGMLGVEVRHARPYNAKSKPIERQFRTLCDRFSKLWRTHCGGSTDARPADLDLSKAPPWDGFEAAFGDWLDADYHQRPHTGHGMNGLSPAAVYRQQLTETRPIDARLLDTLTMRRSPLLRVGRNGVTWNKLPYGRSELADRTGQLVQLAIDDRDVSAAQVYDEAGKLICVARCNVRLPFFADREQIKAAMAEEKADRKLRRDFVERRPRLADSLEDRLYRKAAAVRAARLDDDAPEPVSNPVRTPLDEQLPAIQEAMKPTRKAVGAEDVDVWGAITDAMRSGKFEYKSEDGDDDDDDPISLGFMSYTPDRAKDDA